MASAPLVADAPQHRLVGHLAQQRLGIDLPVAGMEHRAEPGADRQRIGLEDRMRHGDQLELERRQAELAAERDLGDRHRIDQARLDELAPQHRGGERRGIDRRLEARPEIGDGAQVILVGMGQHDADQVSRAAPR